MVPSQAEVWLQEVFSLSANALVLDKKLISWVDQLKYTVPNQMKEAFGMAAGCEAWVSVSPKRDDLMIP